MSPQEPVAAAGAYLDARRAALTVGTRVVVQSPEHLFGQTGIVIEMSAKLLNGHDCAVLLGPCDEGDEGDAWPLCFYAHELAVES